MSRIERQPDRLSAGLDSAGISSAVKTVRELDSTVRIYKKTWMTEIRLPSEEACREYFEKKFDGRVTDDDWKIIPSDNGKHFILKLNVWNVISEWASAELGQSFMDTYLSRALPDEAADIVMEMVTRNSKREHELKAYSINKLPATKAS